MGRLEWWVPWAALVLLGVVLLGVLAASDRQAVTVEALGRAEPTLLAAMEQITTLMFLILAVAAAVVLVVTLVALADEVVLLPPRGVQVAR
jgi:hypothetical protein